MHAALRIDCSRTPLQRAAGLRAHGCWTNWLSGLAAVCSTGTAASHSPACV